MLQVTLIDILKVSSLLHDFKSPPIVTVLVCQSIMRCFTTHALCAIHSQGYCKPEVVESGSVFHVRGGWHPVVSSLQTEAFVCNDCDMSENRLWIITGPNMGGWTPPTSDILLD